jgi:ABC-type glycerol-3-phosphate transport system substrate-binding protein
MRGRWIGAALVLGAALAACGGGDAGAGPEGRDVTVFGSWPVDSEEGASFAAVLEAFEERTGHGAVYQGVANDFGTVLATRLEGGNAPDVALLPAPGLLRDLATLGVLHDVEPLVGDAVDASYAPIWRDLGTVDGTLYGVWFKAANKSTVWFDPRAFAEAGVEPPDTWDKWIALSETLLVHGVTPVAVGGADGWVLSDWFENVYLRTAGAERYDDLTEHRIPWTDPSVAEALDVLGDLLGMPDYVLGGSAGALQMSFEDSITATFGAERRAAVMYEGDFVPSVIAEETQAAPGVDYDFFEFPSIAGSPPAVVGGGDVAVLLGDSEGAGALVEFLATPEAAEVWAARGGFSSPNRDVDPEVYPDPITRRAAQQLVEAELFRFDLSDLVPGAFGSTDGAGIWGQLQRWLEDPAAAGTVLEALEREAQAAYE